MRRMKKLAYAAAPLGIALCFAVGASAQTAGTQAVSANQTKPAVPAAATKTIADRKSVV